MANPPISATWLNSKIIAAVSWIPKRHLAEIGDIALERDGINGHTIVLPILFYTNALGRVIPPHRAEAHALLCDPPRRVFAGQEPLGAAWSHQARRAGVRNSALPVNFQAAACTSTAADREDFGLALRPGRDQGGTMLQRLLLVSLLFCAPLAFVKNSSAQESPARYPADDEHTELGSPGPSFVVPSMYSTWIGGPTSLPYNNGASSQTLVSHALTIDGVQEVISAMLARGYVRRADGDTGFTGSGRSTVIISFEKPGVPLQEQQPFVYVSSFAIYRQDWNGFIPVTMVMGASASDSAGYPVHRNDPNMPPIGLVSIVDANFHDAVAGDEDIGDTYRLAYSIQPWMYDPNSPYGISFVHYQMRMLTEEQLWWGGLAGAVTAGALAGSISGAVWGAQRGPYVFPSVLFGAFSGASGGAVQYQLTHRYPTQ